MVLDIRMLGPGDEAVLTHVADDVCDNAVNPALAREFLTDPRHHIAVAVAPNHQRRGLGRASTAALLAHGRSLGCVTAWVLTDRDNEAAKALYARLGGVEGDEGLGESLRGFVFKLGPP